MNDLIIMFFLMYFVSLISRSFVMKERKKIPFLEGLKSKENQATAILTAIVVTIIKYFL